MPLGNLVLTAIKEPEFYFSNPTVTTEEICTAHIQANKSIKERMDEIKAKYNLNDETEWRKVVLEAGKRKRAQAMAAIAGKGSKGGKDGKDGKAGKAGKGDKNGKDGKGGKGTPSKNKFGKKNVEKKAVKNTTEESAQPNENGTPKANKKKGEQQQEKKSPKPKNSNKKEKSKSSVDAEPDLTSDAVASKITTEDAFFITANGGAYQSTAVVDRVQADGPDDGLDRKERRAKQFGKPTKPQQNKKFKKCAAGENRDNTKVPTESNDHPSWAAKRQQKIIPNFQGKKMKFNDDGTGDKTQNTVKPVEKNIHPSWAAKQKMKPVLAEFKGSKITFD